MKKLAEKFQNRGHPQPGSSTAPTTGAAAKDAKDAKAAKDTEAAKTAKDATNKISVENFVNKVIALASGRVTGDEHVKELAGMIGKAVFSIDVSGTVAQYYWVGLQADNKVRFTKTEPMLNDPKYRIPSSLVVPTTPSKDLAITVTNKKLESIAFKTGQYQELDLATVSAANCLFVLTTQFTGCTFAIGSLGTKLYMGHAMRSPGVEFAQNGTEVAASLQAKRKTMFQNVGNLESTFFVSLGKEFKTKESDGIITYTDKVYTNVIGLVCNRKVYFIVATKLDSQEIEKVVLVTQETDTKTGRTKKWKIKELPKSW